MVIATQASHFPFGFTTMLPAGSGPLPGCGYHVVVFSPLTSTLSFTSTSDGLGNAFPPAVTRIRCGLLPFGLLNSRSDAVFR